MSTIPIDSLHVEEPLPVNGSAPLIRLFGINKEEQREVEVRGFVSYIGAMHFIRAVRETVSHGKMVRVSDCVLV